MARRPSVKRLEQRGQMRLPLDEPEQPSKWYRMKDEGFGWTTDTQRP